MSPCSDARDRVMRRKTSGGRQGGGRRRVYIVTNGFQAGEVAGPSEPLTTMLGRLFALFIPHVMSISHFYRE